MLYAIYPVSGKMIRFRLPNLSDHGPAKSENMIGGRTLTIIVTVWMAEYVYEYK